MMRILPLYILLLLWMACKEPGPKQKIESHKPEEKEVRKTQQITPEKAGKFSYKEAKEAFGRTLREEEILLGRDPLHEFRGKLSVIFTKEEIHSKTIKIKEITWEKDTRYNITVWYQEKQGKWMPIDVFQWDKEAVF